MVGCDPSKFVMSVQIGPSAPFSYSRKDIHKKRRIMLTNIPNKRRIDSSSSLVALNELENLDLRRAKQRRLRSDDFQVSLGKLERGATKGLEFSQIRLGETGAGAGGKPFRSGFGDKF